jgi:hypothetical protein
VRPDTVQNLLGIILIRRAFHYTTNTAEDKKNICDFTRYADCYTPRMSKINGTVTVSFEKESH